METRKWYKDINKSPLNPPSYLFGIVWPILYSMLLIYFSLIFRKPEYKVIYKLFIIQMLFNFIWSPIFFKFKKFKLALIVVLIMVGMTAHITYSTYNIDKKMALILVPYLLWISFATYLNGYIAFYN
jgi:translocator protein